MLIACWKSNFFRMFMGNYWERNTEREFFRLNRFPNIKTKSYFLHCSSRGSAEENEFHICVRVCGVEGHGKSLSGQFFLVCEKDREESSTKSLGGMTRPKDEMGSQIVSSESDISYPIHVFLSRNNNSQAQARRFSALTAPEPEFPVIFGSKWDPLTSEWRQGGASPERLAELPMGVSPLQKRIWKWDFYHCSSCNFFFHICFCHLWCELPLSL